MDTIKGYDLVKEYDLKDINSKGYLFRHIKTGARVCVISNDDNNKVFSIGFRTPPKDSTGAPHIVEHTVLCGSRKFKAKDPFIELAKGSLNTFLNAMTYPDKTVYPIASCNDKDFKNLMDVYLDSVFYPNIYNEEKIFMQEGWHYELEDEDAPLKYNGVVYNEMKGAFSSPDQVLFRNISTALFPDTTYATESGGDPEYIPDLTYEQFLEFHSKYYHPSNSYIYLYGDMDVKERLEWMDKEYLNNFDKLYVDSHIDLQKPFDDMREYKTSYPVTDSQEDDDKTYLAYASSFGLSTDSELCIAFEVLSYCLVEAPGAPLKQALLDKGYAREILCDFESEIRQPVFTIIAKDSKPEYKADFVKTIKDTLTKIVKEGIPEDDIRATLSRLEFQYREADYDRYPKGLMYGLDMYAGWLYDDDLPFATLELNKVYDSLRDKIGTGYYEELVKQYLIDNTHASVIELTPDKELGALRDDKLRKKLDEYKKSLSHEEVLEIVKTTKELKEYQQSGSTKEELATIPMLTREDIDRNPLPLCNEVMKIEGADVVWHDIYTNNIIYCDFLFDLNNIPLEMIPYMGLFTTALGYFDTDKHTYQELSNLINMYTGGISAVSTSYVYGSGPMECDYKLKVSLRTFYHYADKAFELLKEIINDTLFNDDKHLLEIIRETRSRMQSKIEQASHSIAVQRCQSYYSKSGMYGDLTSGIYYYGVLVDIEKNFDKEKDTVKNVLKALLSIAFSRENALVSVTCDKSGLDKAKEGIELILQSADKKGACDINLDELAKRLDSSFVKDGKVSLVRKNEGFKSASQVQYVCRAGNCLTDEGLISEASSVLKTILSYDYLWNNVRVDGGAYGCMVDFSRFGNSYMVSYRDPNLSKTNDTFERVTEYIENFDASEEEMTKYVIGTIGRIDTPLTPRAKGNRDFIHYYNKTSYEELKRRRDEVIDVTVEDIRKLAPYISNMLKQQNICTIGNEAVIEENKELFKEIKTLD